MLAKTLKRTAFGFLLGMAVGNLIAALTGHPQIVSALLLQRAGSFQAALLLQTLLSGAIGGAGFLGISFYEIERCPLLLATLAQYAAYMAVFLFSAVFLGWTQTATELLVMCAIMTAFHIAIFLIMCNRYRAQVREFNAMQEQFQLRIQKNDCSKEASPNEKTSAVPDSVYRPVYRAAAGERAGGG